MKKTFLLLFLFFSLIHLTAQNKDNYSVLVAKANLLHLQKNYSEAIVYYEKAFKMEHPDALTAYKAAGVYALAKHQDKAFHYLQKALDLGWTEADWLAHDLYFTELKEKAIEQWKTIIQQAYQRELQYTKSLKLPSLRKEINEMTLNDQKLRFKRIQASNDSLLSIIDREINQSDFDNLTRAKQIIKQYGWPKISEIGKDGQNNLWLIVQHADQDVEFQKTALFAMEKLKPFEELNMENYAFLYDRVQSNLNYKQVYGTQVLWTNKGEAPGFRPMKKEHKVNKKRKKMGMPPLEIYSLIYGFSYKPIATNESKKKDQSYRKQVQDLINKAKQAYKNKEFQKTYDYYNEASTFLGGMSDNDNYEASIIFSKIAAVDKDEKYKSIALDFLSLLKIRDSLNKQNLLKEPSFKILHRELRWIEMLKSI